MQSGQLRTSRLYTAVLALEGGARDVDVVDLRRIVAAFADEAAFIAIIVSSRRFAAFADRLGSVVDALELGDAAAARRALEDGLSAFALA